MHDRRDGVIEVGATEAGTREETEIAAQGARYGPQVRRSGSLAPLADNIADEGERWTRLVRQFGGLAKVDRVGFYAASRSVISAVA